jgi:selenocysteine lyase/cysteine desulfurase
LATIWERVHGLAEELRRRLAALPGVRVRDLGRVRSGIVSFEVAGRDPLALKAALAEQGINISTTSVASTRLDMESRGIALMNRLGVHYYNSEEELQRFLVALARLA